MIRGEKLYCLSFYVHFCPSFPQAHAVTLTFDYYYLHVPSISLFIDNLWHQCKTLRIIGRALIIIITCNWVVTKWQLLFYVYTKYEIGY